MKRLFLISLFLLFTCSSAFGLIVTDNVDKDKFQYEVGYSFASPNLAASLTAVDIPINSGMSINHFQYVVPRDGRLVGIAVAGDRPLIAGAATFDVTINNTVTGVQTVVELAPVRSAIGNSGSSGSQYAYMRQDRAETAASRGFRGADLQSNRHDANNPFGKATALTAGNRIGLRVTTSSDFAATTFDCQAIVYVLE